MQPTDIEWTKSIQAGRIIPGYVWNPIPGMCPEPRCPWCWAIDIYVRYKWNTTIRLDQKTLEKKHPHFKHIFTCSTIDLLKDGVDPGYAHKIIRQIKQYETHCNRYFFLTKHPKRLKDYRFPSNCWIGVTITCQEDLWRLDYLLDSRIPNVKFLSIEPLIGEIDLPSGIGSEIYWIIVGQMNKRWRTKYPACEPEWIEKITKFCARSGIALFEKDNLISLKKIQFQFVPTDRFHIFQNIVRNRIGLKIDVAHSDSNVADRQKWTWQR